MRLAIAILLMFFTFSLTGQTKFIINKNELELSKEDLENYSKSLPNSFDLSNSVFWPNLFKQDDWVCNQVAASYYMFSYESNYKKNISSKNKFNCFSIYFPFNFDNGGYGWYGPHYIITMEMLKKLGVPKYGEFLYDTATNVSRWMSGYDLYYSAMHNKIDDYYGIKVNSAEGIETLKAWIFDHGGGAYGGTATFMANIKENGGSARLPKGSSHQGAYAMVICGDDALHARTIVGYDDNICYDYNNDGKFTNHIDINGDGKVDVHDWEKGGFKLAEANGPDWQGDGYMWITYKAMADAYGQGGILNNLVHVLIPKIDYSPKLTAKFKINHPQRRRLKISIGIATDTEADIWDYLTDFPVFNYQGGDLYMQGGNSEADKSIEAGLDLTNLISYFDYDNCAKLFFVIDEYDKSNSYPGFFEFCSFIDYSNISPKEYVLVNSNTNINNNSRSVFSKVICLDNVFKPKINTLSLPVLSANTDNNYQFDFIDGYGDSKWELLSYFDTSYCVQDFNYTGGTKLTPDDNFDGTVELQLPFYFNFGKIKTNKIKIHTDGYILVSSESNAWTQFRENLYPLFLNENIISPFARFNFVCDNNNNNGIWYKTVGDTVKIWWNCSDKQYETSTKANFGCNLIANGDIEFLYGDISIKNIYTNICGISYANQSDNIILWKDHDIPAKNTKIKIKQYPVPEGLRINSSGVLKGKAGLLNDYPMRVKISDFNENFDIKTYYLTTSISEDKDDPEFLVFYPNPILDFVNIRLNMDDEEIKSISVFDSEGKFVIKFSSINSEEFNLDLSNYISGIYNFVIKTENFTFNKKLVKI
ncbi:MAG: T9SS type A sorting domain-containing protein [Bacteroidales bacterium]|nr:T9SS type A sorting domain-containing protein [Bacteroidales bacterium]MCK9498952.1 T9SS type A sorting domain-containing protein [Bacteroidales bacterium]